MAEAFNRLATQYAQHPGYISPARLIEFFPPTFESAHDIGITTVKAAAEYNEQVQSDLSESFDGFVKVWEPGLVELAKTAHPTHEGRRALTVANLPAGNHTKTHITAVPMMGYRRREIGLRTIGNKKPAWLSVVPVDYVPAIHPRIPTESREKRLLRDAFTYHQTVRAILNEVLELTELWDKAIG